MTGDTLIQAGKRAVVVGMGVSGRAIVKFLLLTGVSVSVSDSRQLEALPRGEREYLAANKILFEGGGHSEKFLLQADYIVLSPGVPTDLPVLEKPRSMDIPILGELALAAPHLKETVVAVTGTNGKTTVTALIAELLRAAGKKVFVGGNIGTPVLDYVCADRAADVIVLELSSFQLESAGQFRPDIGLLLNVTADHLDWHKTMEKYVTAKMKMFSWQGADDSAILSGDDQVCLDNRSLLTAQKLFCFGAPESGCAVRGDGKGVTVRLDGVEESHYSLQGTDLDSNTGMLNAAAAILTATLLHCQKDDINKGLHSFRLAPHRLQFVRSLAGVDYYDDSKATNSGAVISALDSFSENIILIAGGKEKGEDFTVLGTIIHEKVKALILIGEAASSLAAAADAEGFTHYAESMAEAVSLAGNIAFRGDTVLLAPACASFDMFDNYGHRGQVFSREVMALVEQCVEDVA